MKEEWISRYSGQSLIYICTSFQFCFVFFFNSFSITLKFVGIWVIINLKLKIGDRVEIFYIKKIILLTLQWEEDIPYLNRPLNT